MQLPAEQINIYRARRGGNLLPKSIQKILKLKNAK